MTASRRLAVARWVLCAAALATGCSATEAQQSRTPAAGDVVATVGSTSITLAQVDEKAMQTPIGNFGNVKLSQALYDARRAAVDVLIAKMLVDQDAKARGMTPTDVMEFEVTAKAPPPTDAEVAAWFAANQARLQGASLDQVRVGIKNFLTQQRTDTMREQYLDRLKAKSPVRVMLEPPRQTIATAGHQSKGPSDAPIEFVEFSDFQCPFCLRANPTVVQVMSTYGDRIRLVYRHFPLTNHPNARPAAEASACAAEQGKFWQYHDDLFRDPSKLADNDLKTRAAAIGVDVARFNACFDSHKYKAEVDQDIKEAEEAGVTGTPAFFINGRSLSGAQPFEAFKRIIDEELSLKK